MSTARPGARFFCCSVRGGGNSLTHWRVRGCVWLEQRARFFCLLRARRAKQKKNTGRVFFCSARGGPSKKKTFFLERAEQKKKHPRLCVVGTEGAFFVCSVRGGGNSLPHWRVCGCVWLKKRARFFFAPCAARGNSLTHWRIRGRVFFFVLCAAGEIHSLTGASTAVCGFFLLFARRGKFTHSLARPGALFFCLLRARRWTFTHSLARPGVIHSLTGASGGAFFFLLRARWGKFTHSLARPRLCVVGTEGAFFLFAPCAAGQAKKKHGARFFLFGMRRAEQKKTFFLERAEQKKKHPRLCVVGTEGAFFVCSVRGGGNSLPHWRVCGCVWLKKRARFFFAPCAARGNSLTHWRIRGRVFFFVLCAAGEIHSLTGASTAVCGFFLLFARRGKFTHSLARPGALFFCLLCARRWTFTHSLARPGVIHSLTGASGRVFFFAPCAVGEIHSLTGASAAVCGWNRGRVFFVCSVRGGPSKKKKHGARFFFVRHAAGRAKKKLFF